MQGWAKITQAAKYAGVSERTFRAWLKDGLPYSAPPVGPCIVRFGDIDDYLKRYTASQRKVDEIVDSITRGL